jgi:sugar lactone lactonase YvrE
MRTATSRNVTGAVLLGLLGSAIGCRSAPENAQPLLFFPAPPDAPRVQFLTWASGPQEVERKRSSFEDFVLGEQAPVIRPIDKPYGVAARDGVVYVCDTKGLGVCRLDYKDKTYSVIGTQGPGRLRKPINIVIDDLGYKFVVDTVRRQVVVFGPDDQYVTAHNVPEPCRPVDVALYGNELYVLDNDETCQIVVLDRGTGEVLRTFGGPGGEPGQFRIPNSLCISPDGYVYVSDTHNFRIQKLTRDGTPVWTVGVPGYRLGQFGRPRGIRVGPDGIVYVVDGATELVQMFDPKGEILMRFGGPGTIPGSMILPATLTADKTSLPYFAQYVHKDFKVDYLLFVTNQYGPYLVQVYAFGAFPEGYKLAESQIATLPPMAPQEETAPGEGAAPPETPGPPPASRPAPEGHETETP